MPTNVDGVLPIGCDLDVTYNAELRSDGTPRNNGTATWYFILLGKTETVIGSGDAPRVVSVDGRYATNIPSTYTSQAKKEAIYAVRIVFEEDDYNDEIEWIMVARIKRKAG